MQLLGVLSMSDQTSRKLADSSGKLTRLLVSGDAEDALKKHMPRAVDLDCHLDTRKGQLSLFGRT